MLSTKMKMKKTWSQHTVSDLNSHLSQLHDLMNEEGDLATSLFSDLLHHLLTVLSLILVQREEPYLFLASSIYEYEFTISVSISNMKSLLSSLFSTAKKTSDYQKQLHVHGDSYGQAAPANGDSSHAPKVNSLNQPQHETVNRELGHVDWCNDGGQPPSVSAVRPVVVSQPSGGNQMSMGGQPPSLNDVGRRGASQTGESLTGNQPMDDEQELAGMSLVGNKFRDVFPMAYRNEN
ncbi:hypothetical protein L6452_40312 [Arctium lappa]|uniref:Uncharacterized protein n=1 Tax=Arctium lappa TaxID=4217 RepID=A0ACB8XLI9_ARCLA|nr:hypothetical protein L6452_40312 [Arctium lappa]